MKTKFTRVAYLLCALIMLTGIVSAQSVIHYWDFNETFPLYQNGGDSLGTAFSYAHPYASLNAFSGSTDSLNKTAMLYAPYTTLSGTPAYILYSRPTGKQGNAKSRDSILDNANGGPYAYINDLHILGNDTDGDLADNNYVRSRNPDENSYMYLYMPTTGYYNIVLNYALSASSTKGANYNIFSYSTNGGSTWNNLTGAMDTFNISGVYRPDTLQAINPTTGASLWYPVQINFSSDVSVNNNANFIVRWEFEGANSTGSSGNDRYDNISLSGDSVCPKFTQQPSNYIQCGGGGGSASFSVQTTGGDASVTYQWLVNTGSGFTGIGSGSGYTGYNTDTLSITSTNGTMNGYQYECVVNDAICGTIESNSATLIIDGAVIASVPTYSNVTCNGNGIATASATGGATPYTYSWSNSQTTVTATNLIAGTYTVTVSDLYGCSGTASVAIINPGGVALNILSTTNIECTAFGSAIASASNGISPYTYSWSDGETSSAATTLSAGTFTIMATDNTGCSNSTTVTISQFNQMRDSINAQKDVIHYWDFNQTFPLYQNGGDSLGTVFSYTHPYASLHAFSGSADSIDKTATLYAPYTALPGTPGYILYTRPTGAQGSAKSRDSILDNANGGPYAYVNDLHVAGNDTDGDQANNMYIRSRNPDENSYMYLYMPTTGYNNIVLNYALSASSTKGANYNIFSYSTNGGGTWKNLTKAMDTFNISGVYRPDTLQAINPTTGSSIWYPVQINFSSDLSVNNNANFVVRWEFGGANSTGSSGNDRYDNISLSGNAIMEECSGGNNITAVAGVKYGSVPYTYIWTPNVSSTSTASNLSAGTYSVTIRDALGCSATSSITVTQPAPLSTTASVLSNVLCSGSNTGIAQANPSHGTLPYTYSWSSGGGINSTATGLSAGRYTLTVQDHCGTTVTATVNIIQPATAVTPTAFTANNVTCNGGITGTAKVSVSGGKVPYTYSWSPAVSSTYIASGLSAGTYTVTVTDNNGCSGTSSTTLTQPATLRDSVAIVSYPLCGGETASATIGVTGGTLPYKYMWSPNVSSASSATGLTIRGYVVQVKDNNGCYNNLNFSITQPSVPVLRDSIVRSAIINVSCNGGNTGSVAVGVKYGTAPYTYSWSAGAGTNSTATGLSVGTYVVIVNDAGGCTATTSVNIGQPGALSATAFTSGNVSCNGGSNGQAKVSVSGGSAPYTYFWSSATGSTYIAGGLSAGTYTITVSDQCGASATSSAVITQPAVLSDSVATISYPLCTGGTGSATIGVSGGTSPYKYTWSPNVSTTASATGLTVRGYVVQVKDNNGCYNDINFSLTQPAALRDSIVKSATVNISCNGASAGSATAGVKYGTTPYTYSWSPAGGNSATAIGLSGGTYTVTVSDGGGCTVTASVNITQPAALSPTAFIGAGITCNGASNGTAKVSVSGGSAPYTYLWSPVNSSTYIVSGLSVGTYTVTITDNCSSSASASVTVTQPAILFDSVASVIGPPCSTVEEPVETIATGGTATIGVTGGTSPYRYTWSPNVSTTATATGLTVRTYVVQVKDNNGCYNDLPVVVTCSSPADATYEGTGGASCCPPSDNINLYPNPNTGQFTLAGLQQGMILETYDYTGKMVSAMTVNTETMQININQANGIYLVRILDKDGNLVSQKKVVKVQ